MILAVLLIYFVGKYFYNLAAEYGRSKWGFAILSIVLYFGSQLLFGLVFGIVMGAIDPYALDDFPEFIINLLGLLIGFLSLVILAKVLRSQWSKKPVKTDEALDSGLINEE